MFKGEVPNDLRTLAKNVLWHSVFGLGRISAGCDATHTEGLATMVSTSGVRSMEKLNGVPAQIRKRAASVWSLTISNATWQKKNATYMLLLTRSATAE